MRNHLDQAIAEKLYQEKYRQKMSLDEYKSLVKKGLEILHEDSAIITGLLNLRALNLAMEYNILVMGGSA